jgi:hypothetical protein
MPRSRSQREKMAKEARSKMSFSDRVATGGNRGKPDVTATDRNTTLVRTERLVSSPGAFQTRPDGPILNVKNDTLDKRGAKALARKRKKNASK